MSFRTKRFVRRATVAVAVLAIIVLGTTRPGPLNKQATKSVAAAMSTKVTLAVAEPVPTLTVAKPWQPGMEQHGINIYWSDNLADDADIVNAKARRILDYTVGLGANAIAISFPIYVDGLAGNTVKTGPKTPSPERLALVVAAAKQRKLRVTVRPLIDEQNLMTTPGGWRGVIRPSNRGQWFQSYLNVLTPYLATAAAARAETFTIGAELNSLEADPAWNQVAAAIRSLYHGELAYSANWDYYGVGKRVPPVDAVGMDAYPVINLDDNASLAAVTSGWDNWLRQAGKHANLKQTVIHEVGVSAQPGSYRKPWAWDRPDAPLRLDIQATWITAACTSMRRFGLPGLYVWRLDFHADPAKANPRLEEKSAFIARPAEVAIMQCFAG